MSAVQGVGSRGVLEAVEVFRESGQERIQFASSDLKTEVISFDQLVKQVEETNRFFLNRHTHLQFSIHKETKSIIVRIINSETQEVIKEIPPEKILDLVAKLWEMAGLLIDERR